MDSMQLIKQWLTYAEFSERITDLDGGQQRLFHLLFQFS